MRLEAALEQYNGNDQSIHELKSGLTSLLQLSLKGEVQKPIHDNIPGHYQWTHHALNWPDDIRNAYHDFRVEISGGLSEQAKAFLESRKIRGK
ncbi:hypothetical protein NBRC116495_26270 [Aurantivibrio plasticivorans]